MYNLDFYILVTCALPVLFVLAGFSMYRLQRGEYSLAFTILAILIYFVRVDIIRYFTFVYGVYNLPKDSILFTVINSNAAFAVCQLLIFASALNLMRSRAKKEKR